MIRLTAKQGSIVQTFSVDGEKAFIGRLPANSVRLEDDTVSRKHCMIRRTADGGLEVLDLNSRHGIRKNGESIERARVEDGDELFVGDVRLIIGFPPEDSSDRGYDLELAPPPDSPSTSPKPEQPAPAAPPVNQAPAREGKELISDARRTTFSGELYRHLRRTPWWAASVLLHTMLIYLLFFVAFEEGPEDSALGVLNGKLEDDLSSYLDRDMGTPEDLQDEFDELEDDLPTPEFEDRNKTPADEMEEFDDLDDPMLPEMGPTMSAFAARLTPSDVSTAVSIPDSAFGQDGARGANQRAGALLERAMRGRGSDTLGALRRMPAEDILVVKGQYDEVEQVLDLLRIEYETVPVRRLERAKLGIRKVIFVNCSNEAPSKDANRRLRSFVESGGYLVGSDWAVENVFRRAFSEYIEPLTRKGRHVITPNEVIGVHAHERSGRHFLMQGTFLDSRDAKWWLEESSYPFRILRPGAVQVLIESEDLRREYGESSVAATFKVGRGRVLHMLGHFYQKEGNLKGAFSAQRLVANFLLAAIRKK